MIKRTLVFMMAMVMTLGVVNVANAAEFDNENTVVEATEKIENLSNERDESIKLGESDVVALDSVNGVDVEDSETTEVEVSEADAENTVELDLSSVEPEDIPIEYIEESKFGCRVKTTSGNLNIRSSPGTNYPIIGKAANGSVVDVSIFGDVKGEWWEVGAKDVQTGKWINGWVNSRYLEYIPGSGE